MIMIMMMKTRMTRTTAAMGLLALAAGLLGVACGSGGSLSGPSATAGGRGVTIQGTVNGGAGASSVPSASSTKAAGLKVSVVGSSLSTATNDSGQFILAGAPDGHVILRFEGQGVDARVELLGLVSGQTIKLEVNVAGTQAVTASSEAEFTGSVTVVGTSSLNVSGITVLVPPATEIKRGSAKIALSDIKVGETVTVEGALNPDGTVMAREIKALGASPSPTPTPSSSPTPSPSPTPTPSTGSPIEFSGAISNVGATSLVVSGRTVSVNSSTEIKRDGVTARLADLKTGDTAKVEGLLSNGDVLAREIKATSGSSPATKVKFNGTIQSITLPSSLMVSGTKVVVNGSTEIKKSDGGGGDDDGDDDDDDKDDDDKGSNQGSGSLSSLQVGQRVEVEGTTQSDGSVLAKKIKVDK